MPAPKEKIERICKQCMQVFYVSPWVIKDNAGKFCSRKCVYLFQKTPEQVAIAISRLPKDITGVNNPFYGKKLSPESIEKLRKAHLGKKFPPEINKKKGRKGILNGNYGKGDKIKGERNSNWKGGVTKKNHLIRNSKEYKLWRRSVFERDNWTCIWCNYKGNKLNADHIKPFAYYPELRFAIDNGRTLCVPCHKTTESYLKRLNIK